jgi:hypothetical protein
VRQALSMAIDRWGRLDALSKITIVKPGRRAFAAGSPTLALTDNELAGLTGFRRDPEKARAEAKKAAG